MSTFAYLIVKSTKNRFLELLRKPTVLILYLLVALLLVASIIGTLVRGEPDSLWDPVWLKGIVFSLILLFFAIGIQKGLQSGDVIFDMSDVNFLFVSPVRPQSILLYGVVRMMGMSFLAGIFILFQGGTMRAFGFGFGGLLLIFAGFMMALCFIQVLSLIIYSLTNGNAKRKMLVRIIAVTVFLPMATVGAWQFVQSNGDMIKALEGVLRSPVMSWTPIVGWTAEFTVAFLTGDLSTGFMFFSIMVASGVLSVIYIVSSNPDYYEDVLVASETNFEKKRMLSEGQVNTEATSDKKIKVSSTGIGGAGASAIFYKHVRESFRVNRLGLWGLPSILLVTGSAAFAAIMRLTGESGGALLTILQILMWFQVFMIGTGRGLKELYSHYVYMIPEPSFDKIVWSSAEIVFKVAVESLLAFGIAGFIIGEPPLLIVSAVAVHTLFALMLVGINYLSMRWTGADINYGLLVFIYVLGVIIVMLPGLVPAIIVGSIEADWAVYAGLGILAGWELFVSVVCFASSRGILHKCDLPSVKVK
jgi:hypothetical protein